MKQPRFDDCSTCTNLPYVHGVIGPCAKCVMSDHYIPLTRDDARIDVIGQNGNDGLHYSAQDTQVGGDHYKGMPIQPFHYIHLNGLGFAEGCVVKYVSRWRKKNGVEDLRKARHFLDLLIEMEESNALRSE